MAEVNTPVLDTLVKMNEGIPERSGLDERLFSTSQTLGLAIAVADESR